MDGGFYIVGHTETCTRLAIFTEPDQASKYIATLPDYDDGRYYIDGPCSGVLLNEDSDALLIGRAVRRIS